MTKSSGAGKLLPKKHSEVKRKRLNEARRLVTPAGSFQFRGVWLFLADADNGFLIYGFEAKGF